MAQPRQRIPTPPSSSPSPSPPSSPPSTIGLKVGPRYDTPRARVIDEKLCRDRPEPTDRGAARLAAIAKALQDDVLNLPLYSLEEMNASAMAQDAISPALNAVRRYTLEVTGCETELCLFSDHEYSRFAHLVGGLGTSVPRPRPAKWVAMMCTKEGGGQEDVGAPYTRPPTHFDWVNVLDGQGSKTLMFNLMPTYPGSSRVMCPVVVYEAAEYYGHPNEYKDGERRLRDSLSCCLAAQRHLRVAGRCNGWQPGPDFEECQAFGVLTHRQSARVYVMVYDKTLPEDMGNKSEGQVLGKDSRDGPSMSDKVIPGRTMLLLDELDLEDQEQAFIFVFLLHRIMARAVSYVWQEMASILGAMQKAFNAFHHWNSSRHRFFYDDPEIVRELTQAALTLAGNNNEKDGSPPLKKVRRSSGSPVPSFEEAWQKYYTALKQQEADRLKAAYEAKCMELLPFKAEADLKMVQTSWQSIFEWEARPLWGPEGEKWWGRKWDEEDEKDMKGKKSIVSVVLATVIPSKRRGCNV